jgi:putative SOS response-associated peptidase YedK
MVAYQVSTRVNSPKNDDEKLIEPARADDVAPD